MALRKTHGGFTLMEVLVTIVLVTVALVGVFGGIRSIKDTDAKAHTADRLQRLAAEKLDDIKRLQDPASDGTSGDFTDQGYPNATWTLQEDASSITNLTQITVTASEGKASQSLTTLIFVRPQTATSATGTTGATTP